MTNANAAANAAGLPSLTQICREGAAANIAFEMLGNALPMDIDENVEPYRTLREVFEGALERATATPAVSPADLKAKAALIIASPGEAAIPELALSLANDIARLDLDGERQEAIGRALQELEPDLIDAQRMARLVAENAEEWFAHRIGGAPAIPSEAADSLLFGIYDVSGRLRRLHERFESALKAVPPEAAT